MEANKIRLLIVDDIPETVDNLRKLLYLEPDIEVVGAAYGGRQAIAMSKDLQPDIVLMDINLPDLDGIQATESIVSELPQTQIIMMSVQGETEYLRRSMLAGAREFLTKPFSPDELTAAIRRVNELRPRMAATPPPVAVAPPVVEKLVVEAAPEHGQVIAVYSPKGGVGVSTLAINLALALAEETKERVVLVDGNLQFGDLGVLLNLQPDITMADLAQQAETLDLEAVESALKEHQGGIHVLLAPPRPEMADLLNPQQVRRILSLLQESFSFVVVDTPSSLTDHALNILDLAQQIMLVITPDIPTVKNAKLFFDVIEALGYGTEKVRLVLNQAFIRSGLRDEDIATSIKHPVIARIPNDTVACLTAANYGAPLFTTQRGNAITRSILALAKKLKTELAPEVKAEKASGARAARKGR